MEPGLRRIVSCAAIAVSAVTAIAGCKRRAVAAADAGGRTSVVPTVVATVDPVPTAVEPESPPSIRPGSTYDHCDEDNRQIYVISEAFDLYRFPPALKRFVRIGHVHCPGGRDAFSMAVDRQGFAWVLDSEGNLFKVSTKDASCKNSGFSRGQRGGSNVFGMAFVIDEAASEKEKLFVADSTIFAPAGASPRGIAFIDTDLKLSPFIPYRGGRVANFELTGMSDGRLYGFDPGSMPPRILEINRKTGELKSERKLGGVVGGGAWAIAQHYGDLYVFASPPHGRTRVTKVVLGVEELQTIADLDFAVVGAGVSTCAPSGH